MQYGFWEKLQKPILALAPMYDVTDTAFRQIVAKTGKPDVFFTEFVSVDGLTHPVSRDKLIRRYLPYSEVERPIVAQIWGKEPKKFKEAASLIQELGFDGIDINMGCPEKKIMKQGSCASLILQPSRAKEIILAAKEGAGKLPVSVKTRLGVARSEIEQWIQTLLETQPATVTIHGRTAKEMSKVPAHWDQIGKAAEIAHGTPTRILGNGDIQTREEALEKVARYGLDGVMIGRGIFQNLWLFNPKRLECSITLQEKLALLLEHITLFEKYFHGVNPVRDSSAKRQQARGTFSNGVKNFAVMKKHFGNYLRGSHDEAQLRLRLVKVNTAEEAVAIIEGAMMYNKT